MKFLHKHILFLFFVMMILIVQKSTAQREKNMEPNRDNFIERLIETLSDNSDQTVDYTTLTEDLIYFYETPLNLNEANTEQLEKLYVLTDIQIKNIIEYVQKSGPMVTIYELSLVKGMDYETINLIRPFITVQYVKRTYKFSMKRFFKYGKNELYMRYAQSFPKQYGYTANELDSSKGYLGSPQALYLRYRFKYGNKFSAGFTADKDAGEQFFSGTQKQGFDFYSAHIFFRDIKFLKAAAIGDYQAQFGQGLTFWSGLAFGKTSFGINLRRNGQGLRPYTSVNENLFMRGGAITLRPVKFMDVTLFYSNKNMDGSLTGDTLLDDNGNEFVEVSSFNLGGLHRTQSEVNKKRNVNEQIFGGNVTFMKGSFKAGVTGVYSKYSASMQRSPDLYNLYRFSGKELANVGVNYQYIYKSFSFFGETAYSSNGYWATVNGVQAALTTFFSFTIYQRYFSPGYTSFYANTVADRRGSNNENGIYLGFDCKPIKNWSISGYFDQFTFPWLRYGVDAPSKGYDFLGQITFTPNRKIEMYARVRHRLKQENSRDEHVTDPLVNINRTNYRFNLTCEVSKNIKLRSRIEMMDYRRPDDKNQIGYIVYQDITYKSLKKPISITARYTLFDASSYDSRVYAYENDVLYFYSIPALIGRGSRVYAVIRYEIVDGIDIWLKAAYTNYHDRTQISSGNSLIDGSSKTDIRAQVRFKF